MTGRDLKACLNALSEDQLDLPVLFDGDDLLDVEYLQVTEPGTEEVPFISLGTRIL